MPKYRDRECKRCHAIERHTATRSEYCRLCAEAMARETIIEREAQDIMSWGYTKLDGPRIDKFNHRCYKVLTPCGHEWTVPYTNLLKQVKNAKSKNLRPACGVCGPKHRMSVALAGYIAKNGVDYDLVKFNDYRKKVRSRTEVIYKNNKHLINPNDLPRGRNSGYHVDHKTPIIECFKQGWSVEMAVGINNLQMLKWSDNLAKGSK